MKCIKTFTSLVPQLLKLSDLIETNSFKNIIIKEN